MKSSLALDTGGIVVSSLCLIHCLFLPLLGAFLPMLGLWSENEWVHKILILIALPLCLNLILKTNSLGLRLPALIGLLLLLLGAFIEPLHEFEASLTVSGALLLTFAHFQNIRRARHNH